VRNQENSSHQSTFNCQMTKEQDSQRCERENEKNSIEVIIYLEVINMRNLQNYLEIMALC
jgi:hypothetical protein